ncbi:lipid-A-disaccharide synthase -containing domain protein, partial [Bacteroides fragilis str. 1007-1-F 
QMDIIGKGKKGSVSFHILDIEYCRILFVVYLWMVA